MMEVSTLRMLNQFFVPLINSFFAINSNKEKITKPIAIQMVTLMYDGYNNGPLYPII